jgi:hypothetical protein
VSLARARRRFALDELGAGSGDLAGLEVAAVAFEGIADGSAVRVWAIDADGAVRTLAERAGRCGTRCVHVELLAELLARGLRSRGSLLVTADGCPRLVARLRAAFGEGVVVVPEG